jgi:hypothetical protein
VGAVLVGLTTSAIAADEDAPGTGILCAYDILAAVVVDAEICGWADTDRGRAVKQVFADTGAYIFVNEPRYPERVAEKQSGVAQGIALLSRLGETEKAAFCSGTDPQRPNYFISMRAIGADEWLTSSREALSIPATPTYGVCF